MMTIQMKLLMEEMSWSYQPEMNEYTFGLDLLGMLFMKEETGNCLIYKSPKSTKQALDNLVKTSAMMSTLINRSTLRILALHAA